MTGFEKLHPREAAGRFTSVQNTAPESPLSAGERAMWLMEGDDHELELVEASAEDEALDVAAALFADRYDDDDDAGLRDGLRVVGVFRGTPDDDPEDLVFIPYDGTSERTAYALLDYI